MLLNRIALVRDRFVRVDSFLIKNIHPTGNSEHCCDSCGKNLSETMWAIAWCQFGEHDYRGVKLCAACAIEAEKELDVQEKAKEKALEKGNVFPDDYDWSDKK